MYGPKRNNVFKEEFSDLFFCSNSRVSVQYSKHFESFWQNIKEQKAIQWSFHIFMYRCSSSYFVTQFEFVNTTNLSRWIILSFLKCLDRFVVDDRIILHPPEFYIFRALSCGNIMKLWNSLKLSKNVNNSMLTQPYNFRNYVKYLTLTRIHSYTLLL